MMATMSATTTDILAFAVVLALACAAPTQGQQPSTVSSWLDRNAKTFAALLQTLNITQASIPQNTTGTLLVPSDMAIAEFLQRMHLSKKEFLARKQLLDLVASYHFIPGYTARNTSNVPTNPTVAVSADVNYILRFYKQPGPKVWVEDVQGNNVTVTQKPIIINKVAIVPIDKVLLSGGYFFSGKDALKHYPQWSDIYNLGQATGWPVFGGEVAAEQDVTLFVPVNAVIRGRKEEWAGLSKEDQKQQLLYHFVKPALSIPDQLKSGKLLTLSKGHDLIVDVKKGSTDVPDVTMTPEVGQPVKINIFNVFAGRSILHGVDGSLQAKLPTMTTAAPHPKATAGHRHLLGSTAISARGRGPSYDKGYNQVAANSIAATNTQQAINAAAEGTIPVSAATNYGSYQAQTAAEGEYCYNCRSWVGV